MKKSMKGPRSTRKGKKKRVVLAVWDIFVLFSHNQPAVRGRRPDDDDASANPLPGPLAQRTRTPTTSTPWHEIKFLRIEHKNIGQNFSVSMDGLNTKLETIN